VKNKHSGENDFYLRLSESIGGSLFFLLYGYGFRLRAEFSSAPARKLKLATTT
jgi:hypothetical protein